MPRVQDSPTIFDRERLLAELENALGNAAERPDFDVIRQHILERITAAHTSGREKIYRRFSADSKAARTIQEISWLMDEVINFLFTAANTYLAVESRKSAVCIAAVGGYGRQELFPYSDIDIVFLYAPDAREQAEEIAGFILYILWDMQLSVGQALRTTDETIAQSLQDITTRTSMLDARLVCGNGKLFTDFSRRFKKEVIGEQVLEFVKAKLEERRQRHRRWGDSRYVLEPNVKEGKGGLRDLQTLYWLARYSYGISRIAELTKLGLLTKAEQQTFRKAAEFFSIVRIYMHIISGRAEERLTFDMQRMIAGKIGYREQGPNKAVERFMKRYFMMTREVGNLTRIFCTVLEAEKKHHSHGIIRSFLNRPRKLEGFVLEGVRLDFPGGYKIKEAPVSIFRLFHMSQKRGLDIHPRALQRISRNLDLIGNDLRSNREACTLFTDILLAKEKGALTLRRMSDAGVLGKFIPEFGRIVGQMQFDMYHVYSVDEHILTAFAIMQDIENGTLKEELPLVSQVVGSITKRRALYCAVLCHDIAKGRGGNHPAKGAKIARKLTKRLGLTEQEQQLTGWLVENHQLLSDVAFKRDISADETISSLADEIKTPERLRLLLLITVADIRAVGPAIWNGWKGSLLRDLYHRLEVWMGAGEGIAELTEEAMRRHMRSPANNLEEGAVNDYVSLGSPVFWGMLDMESHAQIAPAVLSLQSEEGEAVYKMFHTEDSFKSITELLLCLKDRKGLFSMMTGVLAVSGANIQHAKIFTLKNGVAVERFGVQGWQGRVFDMRHKEKTLRNMVSRVLCGALDLDAELERVRHSYPRKLESFSFDPTVIIHNDVSATHSVIEVTAMDKIGLLHDISRVLKERDLSISTAHITTYGEQVVDVFYVKDAYGMKVSHETKLKEIKEALLDKIGKVSC